MWRDPQTLNRYAYTRNNPLKYIDPLGKYIVVAASDPNYQQFVGAFSKMLATPAGRAAVQQIASDPRPAFYKSGSLPNDPAHPNNRILGDTKVIETVTTDPSGAKHGNAAGTVATVDFSHIAEPGVVVDKTGAQTITHETSQVADALGAGPSFAGAQGAAKSGDKESIPGSGDTTGGTAELFARGVDEESRDTSTFTGEFDAGQYDNEAQQMLQQGRQQCQENQCNTTSGNTR